MAKGTDIAAPADLWHARDAESVIASLGLAPDIGATGLTDTDAAARLARFGPNTLPPPEPRPGWRIFLRQFASPLIVILLIAAVITGLQQHWIDTGAIIGVVGIAIALGFWQERKAERDVHALQSLSVSFARVLRNGAVATVPAAEVVVGDVVLLESGEKVAADLRLLDVNGLEADESMLTGESLPVRKQTAAVDPTAAPADWQSMALSGTLIAGGRGSGLAVATGDATQVGEVNRLLDVRPARTPLERLTNRLERRIGVAILAAVAVVMLLGLAVGYSFTDMFRVGVAISVAAIPESLPVILTVAMSVAVTRMVRRGLIVRTLPAVETLGSTTVIASDKTGTLTQNRLTVERLWTAGGHIDLSDRPVPTDRDGAERGVRAADSTRIDETARAMLRAGALTNEATPGPSGDLIGDAVDVAMAAAALRYGVVTAADRETAPLAHMPYEPALSFSQTVRTDASGGRTLYVKGAPDAVALMCEWIASPAGPTPIDRAQIHQANEALGANGLRVLATAHRQLEPDEEPDTGARPAGLVFLGLQGMADPPRHGVEQAVAECRAAGITVKMITGDHPVTARAIGRRLGLDTNAPPITGSELRELDDEALAERLRGTNIAARTSPRDKLRIVRALQDQGHTVAVTGDGVNDAPALRAASIGVAMGKSGTDVARESADLILTDDNFVTIVEAVREGRVTFSAIRKATFFLLSTAVAGLFAISVNVLLDQPLLFLPVQILWINLVTSGIQDIALALEPAEGDELRRRPRPRSEGLLSRLLWWRTVITGTWMGGLVLLAYSWALETGASLDEARTLAMATFVLANFFQVGNARSERRSVFLLNPLRNTLLLWTSVASVGLLWVATVWQPGATLLGLAPLALTEWVGAGLLASSLLALVEIEKLLRAWAAKRRTAR